MIVRVVTPPAAAVVSLELAKSHLIVEHDEDDTLIGAYVEAATATLDGPDGWLGRALGVQTLEARLDGFVPWASCDGLIGLPHAPLISITSVKYDDEDGVEQTFPADKYSLDPDGVLLAYGEAWPTTRRRRGAVRIEYEAGYVDDAIPAPIRSAILLMVGDLYANRETVVVGPGAAKVPMSTTVEHLLAPFRRWSF